MCSSDLKWAYKKALELYEQYQLLQEQFDSVEIFSLSNKDEKDQLVSLLHCLTTGKNNFDRWYPELWPFSEDVTFERITGMNFTVIPSSSFSNFMEPD